MTLKRLAVGLVLLFAVSPAVRAETAPAGAAGDIAEPGGTRIEFPIGIEIMPPDPSKTPKSPSEFDALMRRQKADAVLQVLGEGTKQAGDISAKYPKCHFRIASIEPEKTDHPMPNQINMQVTLLGENNCLAGTK